MREKNVLMTFDGNKGTQWCSVQPDSIERFAREIKGKIHVDITPSENTEAEQECKST